MTSQGDLFVLWSPVMNHMIAWHSKSKNKGRAHHGRSKIYPRVLVILTWYRRSTPQNWGNCLAIMGRELNLMHLWTCKILIFWSIYKFCPHFPPQTYSAVSRIPTFAPSPSLFFTISSSLGRKVVKNMGIILKPPVLMGCVCSFGGCHLVAVSDSCHRPALLCQSQVGGEAGHLQVQHFHLEQGSGEQERGKVPNPRLYANL